MISYNFIRRKLYLQIIEACRKSLKIFVNVKFVILVTGEIFVVLFN